MVDLRLSLRTNVAVSLLFAATAQASAVSTFTSGAEGWDVVTGNVGGIVTTQPAEVFAAGGNPGGHIAATDPDAENTYFRASTAFHGDHADALGGALRYSRRVNTTVIDYDTIDVVLQGAGITLVYDLPPPSQIGAWDEIELGLGAGLGWTNYNSGVAATANEFKSVLDNVSALYVLAEFTNGLVETTSLDNVALVAAAVPAPATISVMLTALGMLGVARRRRCA